MGSTWSAGQASVYMHANLKCLPLPLPFVLSCIIICVTMRLDVAVVLSYTICHTYAAPMLNSHGL